MNYYNQVTERLNIRKVTKDDIESWSEFFENNDRLKFIDASKKQMNKKELAEDWIMKQIKRYQMNNFGMMAAIRKKDNKLVGMGGIIIQNVDGNKEYEIAYSVKPKYWNMGYATEIAKKMKEYAKNEENFEKVISIIDKDNIPSQKVAEKNGMEILFETNYCGLDVYIYGIMFK